MPDSGPGGRRGGTASRCTSTGASGCVRGRAGVRSSRTWGRVSEALRIPTIGIGAGPYCDAQIVVWQDMAGLTAGRLPRFVKRYASLHETLLDATRRVTHDVAGGRYPDAEHSYT